MLAAASLVQVANRLSGLANAAAIGAIACVVIVSGIVQIRAENPYAEIEDIQSVLKELQKRIEPKDAVYVYPGAVPAVDFYVRERDSRFVYGDFHRREPERYAADMLARLQPRTRRIWLLFSHVYQDEDQRIIRDLSTEWSVKPTVAAIGSTLYLASRRSAFVEESASAIEGHSKAGDTVSAAVTGSAASDHVADTFWDWNLRNSRKRP